MSNSRIVVAATWGGAGGTSLNTKTPRLRRLLHGPLLAPVGAGILALLALLLVASVAGHEVNQTVMRDAVESARLERDSAARAVANESEALRRTVGAYSTEPSLAAALQRPSAVEAAAAQALLSTLARSAGSPVAFLSDLAGRNVMVHPAQPELIGRGFAYRDWFKGVSRTGAPYVSTGYRSAAKGNPVVVAVSAPVLGPSGARVGYLTVLWELEVVRDEVMSALQDGGASVTITDQAGNPLSGDLKVDDRGEPLPVYPSETTKLALDGHGFSMEAGGFLQEGGPIAPLGWTVTVAVPTSRAIAQADSFRSILTFTVGVASLLVVLFTAGAIRSARRRDAEHKRLEVKRRRLAVLFATSPVGIMETEADGTIVSVNDALGAMLGQTPTELVGTKYAALLDPEFLPAADEAIAEVLVEGANGYTAERTYRGRDGSAIPAEVRAIAIPGLGQGALHAVFFVLDQRPRLRREAALRASEERFQRVFDQGLIGSLLVRPDGKIIRSNATLANLLGRDRDTLVGVDVTTCFADAHDQTAITDVLQAGGGTLQAEMAVNGSGGQRLWADVVLSWLTENDGHRVMFVQLEDITARRAAEDRLTDLALRDPLTGLPNRRSLVERCERAFTLARSSRDANTRVAALFIDLDGFKQVNDRHGHGRGDDLLVEVARDLESVVRATDTLARLGGDEFVVLIDTCDGVDHLRALARRMGAVVRRRLEGSGSTVSASIGIAQIDLAAEPDAQPEELLRRADAAMYRSKELGRDRYQIFDADLRQATEARIVLEQAVGEGLREDRVSLAFQSVIDIDNRTVVGA